MYDERLVEMVARALTDYQWGAGTWDKFLRELAEPQPHTGFHQMRADQCFHARREASAALDAINASGIALVAPRLANEAMCAAADRIKARGAAADDWPHYWLVMSEAYLAEQSKEAD